MILMLGFALLVAISLLSVLLIKQAQDDARRVTRSLQIMNAVSQIQILTRRAESGQRGYLLTSDPRYIYNYDVSRAAVGPAFASLMQLVEAEPQRVAQVTALRPLAEQKMAELDETLALQRAGRIEEALAIVKGNVGEEIQRQLVDGLVRIKREEDQALQSYLASSRASGYWLMLVNAAGVPAVLGLAALAIGLARHSTTGLRTAQRELESVNLGLEQRVAERTTDLKEANDEIQGFAYIVSHDLRSPLVNIMGFTSELDALRGDIFTRLAALRESAGAPESPADLAMKADFEEALGFIKASTNKMDRLIHAILTLSREGRKSFAVEEVDMGTLVEQIAASMAHQLMARDARITIGVLPRLTSDRLALEQIFTNLIDNAVKYMKDGVAGRIEISAATTPGFVTFSVADNGRGIDEKDRGRVFELFRRSGRQDRPGEGIGLAHVRALVRRMGGVISLESRLGEGSTFKVTLPLRLPTLDRMQER